MANSSIFISKKMDDITAAEPVAASATTTTAIASSHVPQEAVPAPQSRTARFRGHVAALKEKASVQDKLLEKVLLKFIPLDDSDGGDATRNLDENPASSDPNVHVPGDDRPNFNIGTMSTNFRRFNARIGSVFRFQAHALRVLSWKKPTHTVSLLAVYSFVCIDPSLMAALPLAMCLFGIFIPAFMARHPASSDGETSSSSSLMRYSTRGPPIAPALTVNPVKELSKDFFRNMRDLQNCMDDFTQAHDAIAATLIPATNFSDEALSSALFVMAAAACLFMLVAAHLLPWRLLLLAGGWAAIVSGHPAVARLLADLHEKQLGAEAKASARSWLDDFVGRDIILDSAPDTREVEIFELQRCSSGPFGRRHGAEWEPWLFAPWPYDPLSQARLAGERPRGTRFFEDVLPPEGWEWSEKKWALDLWSREWVEERIITGVEVETEGERWVYDMADDETGGPDAPHAEAGAWDGLQPSTLLPKGRRAVSGPSWEEATDDVGSRGEWRRRRWVRLVKRKKIGMGA